MLGIFLCLGNISLKCHSDVLKHSFGVNIENTASSRNRYLQLHVKWRYLARINIVQLGKGRNVQAQETPVCAKIRKVTLNVVERILADVFDAPCNLNS